MDSSTHGPGGDESRDSKPAALLSGYLDSSVEVPETIATSRAPATEALVIHDEGKEGGQAKAQQQKPALKKPDKVAPCPRCDSLDTKFCYYNNYNVNQPRHFCKNCQRYWTAGGTLRNVPVGAGRRKNKHGSLQARHASMSDHPVVRLDSVGLAQPRPCLSRGQSVPDQISPLLATSSSSTIVSSVPSCHERCSSDAVTQTSTIHVEAGRRHHIPEPQMSISSDHGGSRLLNAEHGGSSEPELACEAEKDDCPEACTSSAPGFPSQRDTAPTAHEVQSMVRGPPTTLQPVCAGVVRPVGILDASVWTAAPTPFGLYNGSWPYGYNVGWSGPPPGTPGTPICPPGGTLVACQPGVGGITAWPAPTNGLWSGVCWGSTIIPGIPPGLAGPPWMTPGWGGGWSIPWGADAAAAAAAAASAPAPIQVAAAVPTTGSGTTFPSRLPIRPVLSKHPRDRLELERVESSLWVPKMVRLDDPGNVTRSSVWTAVGAENRLESVTSGSNFKAFLPVGDNKASVTSGDMKQVRS